MANCLKSLKRGCGVKTTPGVKQKIYVVPVTEVETFPDLKSTTDPGDSVTLDGDIELFDQDAGEGLEEIKGFWRTLDLSPNTGETEFVYESSDGSGGWENTFTGEVSGNDAATVEFANCITGPCGFIAIILKKDGTMRVMGTPDDPCFVSSWREVSGKVIKDKAFNELEFLTTTGDPVPFYEGLIDPIDAPDSGD